MTLAKLDTYDYIILPGVIRISISGNNDPDLVDIFSEIDKAYGNIYVEGCYYCYLDKYYIHTINNQTYMDLEVVRTA